MTARYVAQLFLSPDGSVLVAGAQGLTIVDCEATSPGSGSSATLTMGRNATFTGTLAHLSPLREGDVTSLSTAGVPDSVTGFPATILQWELSSSLGEHDLRPFYAHPLYVAPGSNVLFQGPGVSLNLYIEE